MSFEQKITKYMLAGYGYEYYDVLKSKAQKHT